MRCSFCTQDLVNRIKVEERRDKTGKLIIFNIPAYYCPDCQEFYYTDEVLDWIDKILEEGTPPSVNVPGYVYREEAVTGTKETA